MDRLVGVEVDPGSSVEEMLQILVDGAVSGNVDREYGLGYMPAKQTRFREPVMVQLMGMNQAKELPSILLCPSWRRSRSRRKLRAD